MPETSPPDFASLGVRPEFVAALAKVKITRPTPVQTAGIPVLLEGRDALLNAETGTGKTLAYLLPVFCRLDAGLAATQAVILAPTHELALQIQRQCTDLAQHAGLAVRVLLLIGGTPVDRQIDKLKKKPHIVVGSPGRIQELALAGRLKLQAVRTIVVDEADRLLAADNLPPVRKIIQAAPPGRQLVFVSATEQEAGAAAIRELAPAAVPVRTASAPVNPNIEHAHLVCEERDKPDVLRRLLGALQPQRAMVFTHRNDTAEMVAAKLAHHHIAAVDLHGAYDKRDRKQALDDFRSGRATVLIASDLAARGLDLPGVTHIFNLDVPTRSQAYLHRVGRTARAGASGVAVTLMTRDETRLVRRFETELGIAFPEVFLREGRLWPAARGG
ncbi:MAG: DEAD/DEAH box helicase [Kiritimatiellia bacterium]